MEKVLRHFMYKTALLQCKVLGVTKISTVCISHLSLVAVGKDRYKKYIAFIKRLYGNKSLRIEVLKSLDLFDIKTYTHNAMCTNNTNLHLVKKNILSSVSISFNKDIYKHPTVFRKLSKCSSYVGEFNHPCLINYIVIKFYEYNATPFQLISYFKRVNCISTNEFRYIRKGVNSFYIQRSPHLSINFATFNIKHIKYILSKDEYERFSKAWEKTSIDIEDVPTPYNILYENKKIYIRL